jgi:CDP-paratose 2-epimerase
VSLNLIDPNLLLRPLRLLAANPLRPPRIINVSGGVANSMSLLELSAWCQNRFGPHPSLDISAFPISNSTLGESRPFDIPWLVLDPTLAAETWDWKPATPIQAILEEIAIHAEANPAWLDLVS